MINNIQTIKTILIVLLIVSFNFAGEFKLPKYEKFQLENGITIYLMEQHEVPLISFSSAFAAGAIYDIDKKGVANLTAGSLLFGTKNYTKNQIEETFDFAGAELSTYATKETGRVEATFAVKDQEVLLKILSEIVMTPKFDKKEFEKEKQIILANLEQAKESPKSVIGNYFDAFVFGNNVYSNPVGGDIESVKKVSVDDIRNFYKKYYTIDNAVIALVGDFKISDMKKKISELFGGWKTEKSSIKSLELASQAVSNSRVLLINKEDAKETTFYVGTLGIQRNNPDFIAVQVINTILGGRFTSWLNDELRVNHGLTYGANSTFNAYKNNGSFRVFSYTRNENTEKALDLTVEILNRLHNKGIDETTLTSAKNYINGQFPPRYETSESLAGLLTDMFINNFDESFINNFQTNVNNLSLDKAGEIIKKYFPNKNLQFVLIGKSSEIKKIAEKYGSITEKDIKTNRFN